MARWRRCDSLATVPTTTFACSSHRTKVEVVFDMHNCIPQDVFRVSAPYGLNGGKKGACGLNVLRKRTRTVNLGGKIVLGVEPGVSPLNFFP